MTIGAQIAITTPILCVTMKPSKINEIRFSSQMNNNQAKSRIIENFTVWKELVPLIVANRHFHD